MKLKRPPISRMTHDFVNIPGSPAPIAVPKSFPKELANNLARMVYQFYAAPAGHSVIQASDKSIHHVPTRNLAKAKALDPGLSVLHSNPMPGEEEAPGGGMPSGMPKPSGPPGPAGMLPQMLAKANIQGE